MKIHDFAFCPVCGHDGFKKMSVKQYVCDACGLEFFVNSSAAVAALVRDASGRLLLTRRARNPFAGSLDLPGGFVDPGESAEEALAREVREELGAGVKSLRYVTSHPNRYEYSGLVVPTTDLAFECELDISADCLAPHDDVASLVWLRPEEIDPQQIPFPSIRFFVEHWLANQETRSL